MTNFRLVVFKWSQFAFYVTSSKLSNLHIIFSSLVFLFKSFDIGFQICSRLLSRIMVLLYHFSKRLFLLLNSILNSITFGLQLTKYFFVKFESVRIRSYLKIRLLHFMDVVFILRQLWRSFNVLVICFLTYKQIFSTFCVSQPGLCSKNYLSFGISLALHR